MLQESTAGSRGTTVGLWAAGCSGMKGVEMHFIQVN